MKVAFPQEDIDLLAKILQEQLLAEVPSGETFQVKCAVKNDELMILTQHPSGVTVDTETIFAVLEEALQWQPNYQSQGAQLFLRVTGEKLPYAKHFLTAKVQGKSRPPQSDEQAQGGESDRLIFPPPHLPDSQSPSLNEPISDHSYSDNSYIDGDEPIPNNSYIDEMGAEEAFDPLAGTPDLLMSQKKPALPVQQILLGAAVVGVFVVGGAYFLTRPCVMFKCEEIQTAEKLKIESRQLMRRAKSEKELAALQQQLEAAKAPLASIPQWSSHHQQAEELATSLSGQSEKINQVLKAFQMAASVAQKSQTPANSLAELQTRQRSWQQAIAPLEAIRPNSELYELVQIKLLSYRLGLRTVNQQLFKEQKWVKTLTAAKAVAMNVTKNEATAQSLNDWKKVESTWQIVVNALNSIPQSSSGYKEAQALLTDYKPKFVQARDRATKEQLAATAYQQAVTTGNQAKVYEQNNQWQQAVAYWKRAVEAASNIASDSLYYTQGQSLIKPYSEALAQAEEKLKLANSLAQTRNDLTKTCANGDQFCTFTIDDQKITVRLTLEYDQALQSSLTNPNSENPSAAADLNNHYQTLREALVVISQNANLPLTLYNSQGQEMYMRNPGG
ncbi:hypothetical protein NIES4074_00500 [Cylindrospermum sp. NIES-4074]|nr:hypothetical protein NIES4074_00500 [Cylindrospermum sp. NIES-4074]